MVAHILACQEHDTPNCISDLNSLADSFWSIGFWQSSTQNAFHLLKVLSFLLLTCYCTMGSVLG